MAEETSGSDRVTVIKTGGGGIGMIMGVAVIALVAIVAVFLLVQSNRNTPSERIADAAGSVASSASRAADSVGQAAGQMARK